MRFDLTFLYQPVDDLDAAAEFYETTLGLEEAWREGDDTRAYALPGGTTQIMVSLDAQPAGPMFQVDDLRTWLEQHPALDPTIPPYAIPGGEVAGLTTPQGHPYYVFDQADE